MGHGHFAYRPASVIWRVGLPKVVTTATSDVRTWNRNSSSAKMTMSTAPTAMLRGFFFMG